MAKSSQREGKRSEKRGSWEKVTGMGIGRGSDGVTQGFQVYKVYVGGDQGRGAGKEREST